LLSAQDGDARTLTNSRHCLSLRVKAIITSRLLLNGRWQTYYCQKQGEVRRSALAENLPIRIVLSNHIRPVGLSQKQLQARE
jgi:hypothetical protein